MATVQFEESALITTTIQECSKRLVGFLNVPTAVKMYKALVIGATNFLATVKSTKTPSVFTITDNEGNFIFAFVVEYTDAPDKEDDVTGNWNFYCTFDKNDVPEGAVYDVKNEQTHKPIVQAVWEHTSGRFEGTEALINLYVLAFGLLKDYMMQNAVEGDTFELVYPGVFKAQSAVEAGEKVVSFIPDGLIKKMIKDDEALENAK